MTNPKCPHCKSMQFEITEDEPLNANYKIFIVHCKSCGAPFGAMEYAVAGVLLAKQEKTLAQIQESLSTVDRRVRNIEQVLQHRR